DRIAAVAPKIDRPGRVEIDASGRAVAPGFINMLSHTGETLLADRRALGDAAQGVTTEIFGEFSWGPVTPEMAKEIEDNESDIKYRVEWKTLGEFLAWLGGKGMSVNVASFVGAGTVREAVVGKSPRAPTPAELDQMRALVRRAMEDGALGVTTAL